MAELDTRGFMDGFAQGFGLMDAYYSRQGAKKFRQQEADRKDKWRKQQMGLQRDQFNFRRDQAAESKRRYKQEFDLRKAEDKRQQKTWEQQQQGRQKQQDLERIKTYYGKLRADVELTDRDAQDFAGLMRKYPQYQVGRFMDPEAKRYVETGRRLFDMKDPTRMNSPETIEAANAVYGPWLNKGSPGDKRIVEMHPGKQPGMVVFELEITQPDGTVTRAPMTVGRDTNPDAEVMQVPVDDLIKQFQGYQLMTAVAEDPTFQKNATKLGQQYGWFKAPKNTAPELEEFTDPKTGQTFKARYDSKTGNYYKVTPEEAPVTPNVQALAKKMPTDPEKVAAYVKAVEQRYGTDVAKQLQASAAPAGPASAPPQSLAEQYKAETQKRDAEAEQRSADESRNKQLEVIAQNIGQLSEVPQGRSLLGGGMAGRGFGQTSDQVRKQRYLEVLDEIYQNGNVEQKARAEALYRQLMGQ